MTARGLRRTVLLSLVATAALYAAVATSLEKRAIAAQQPAAAGAAAAPRVDHAELLRVVRTLSAPEYAGRRTGEPGGVAARAFVREAFTQLGLRPALQPFSFTHTSVRGLVTPGRAFQTAYTDAANVTAMVPGTSADGRTIVISAHYDHLGTRNGQIYRGADDNASGIAALLAVARYVQAHPLVHRVIFAAFDAEELGLQGAKAFMKTPPVPAAAIALNINFDMVSRNDRDEIFAAGTYHTPALKSIVDDAQTRTPVKILFGHDRPMTKAGMVEDWTLQSDHGVFHQAGIPFLYFGVEDHPDYHKPSDTADKIDPAFFGNVADMLLDVVLTADRQVR